MTRSRLRVGALSAVAAIAALLVGACGGGPSASGGSASDGSGSDGSASSEAAPSPMSTALDATTINGEIPAGTRAPLEDVTTMLETVDANGKRLVITRGTRKAGTRAPIHIHLHGGNTCVVSGEITDFVEGHPEPMTFPAGTCYYMPPNTLMSAANLGTVDAVLIDTFNLPPGDPTITIREPGK